MNIEGEVNSSAKKKIVQELRVRIKSLAWNYLIIYKIIGD